MNDPRPAPDAPGPIQALDPAQRLRELELRVLARDEALRRDLHVLQQRARHAVSPRRWAVPLAAGGVAIGALGWWLWRGRAAGARGPSWHAHGAERAAASAGAAAAARGGGGARWLVRAIGLGWPLLPAPWRARISPGSAAALASVGLPLIESLLASPRLPPLATVPFVDLRRYMGTWYELARLPAPFEGACAGQPSATYALRGGGVEVVNRCLARDGRERVAVGRALVVPGSGNARLEVSLWPRWLRGLPPAWAPYWIVHLDDDYGAAVVGHPNRRFAWLLSRRRQVAPAELSRLVQIAASHGFAVQRLHFNVPPP